MSLLSQIIIMIIITIIIIIKDNFCIELFFIRNELTALSKLWSPLLMGAA